MNANNETGGLIEKIKYHLEIKDESINIGKSANWQCMYQRYTAPVVLRQIIEYIASVESQLTALRQAQQEPVAYMCDDDDGREYNGHNQFSRGRRGIPLYIHPTAVPSVNEQEPAAFRWRHRADGEFPASKWEYLPADLADRFIERVVSRDRDVECEYVYTAPVITDSAPVITDSERWYPQTDPITGAEFFLWLNHPTLGYVPTYGGPLDSYTLTERDENGEFFRHRYDHDVGAWVDDEAVYLPDDSEGQPIPPAPAVPEKRTWLHYCEKYPEMPMGDAIIRAVEWNNCRAAMLKQSTDSCQLSCDSEQVKSRTNEPVRGGERVEFEKWYLDHWRRETGRARGKTIADVSALRSGDGYAPAYTNGCWNGWRGRADIVGNSPVILDGSQPDHFGDATKKVGADHFRDATKLIPTDHFPDATKMVLVDTQAKDLIERCKQVVDNAVQNSGLTYGMSRIADYHHVALSALNSSGIANTTEIITDHSELTLELVEIPVERDENGYWSHPAWDAIFCDREGMSRNELKSRLASKNLECTFIELECDYSTESEDAVYRYFERGDRDVSDWNPAPPEGDGWFIVSIHETDDGPVCYWVRPIPQSEGGEA